MFGPSRREMLRIIERERAAHRVEVANLLDRLACAIGQPWTLPPRPVKPIDVLEPPSAADRWTLTPEQNPV